MKYSPFYIIERSERNRRVYVGKFRVPDRENAYVYRNIDTLNDELGHRKSKGDLVPISPKGKKRAYMIAQEALDKEIIFKNKKDCLFVDFALSIWDYEGEYQKRQRAQGKANTKIYIEGQRNLFKRHVIPNLPPKLSVSKFQPYMAEDIKNKLLLPPDGGEPKSSSTINNVLTTITTPLEEAYLVGITKENLALRITKVAKKNKKERGIPPKEIVLVMLGNLNRQTVRGTYERNKFIIPALAYYTGMRQGEIRALKPEDVTVIDSQRGKIRIQHAYNVKDKEKCTKGREERTVPCPAPLCHEILEYSKLNPIECGYIFFSQRKPEVPIVANSIIDWYRDALAEAGISKAEQIRLNIDFHSLRHLYASVTKKAIADEDRRKAMGHKDIKTTEGYTHIEGTDEYMKWLGKQVSQELPYNFSI